MPWKKFSVGKGQYKVWKVDEQGEKVGEPLSGKPQTTAQADSQIRALYASEKKLKKESVILSPDTYIVGTTATDADTFTATVTGDDPNGTSATEAKEAKNYGEEMAMPMAMMSGPCSWEEMDAMEQAEEMTGELYEMNDKMGMMARNVMQSPMIEDKAAALADLAKGYAERMTKMATEPAEKSVNDIVKQIAGDNQPAHKNTDKDAPGGDSGKATTTHDLFIWKENDRYYCLLAYSNNRRDDDNPPEIISSESHKEFDQALEKGEWPMPELWLWHIPYKVGDVFYHAYDEQNGFPIAGAVFDKDKDWLAEGLLEAGWDGVSHGMPEQWIERDKEDSTIIVRHRTKEISILPKWAAANKLAFTYVYKENEMAEQEKSLPAHKREALNELGEDKAQKFLAALGEAAEKADEAGIEKKALEAETPATEAPMTPDNPVVKALEMVVSRLDALDTRLKTIEDKQTETVEEKEQSFDLMEFLKGKSAIGQPTTKVDGRSKEAKDAPEEAKQESWTERASGIRVSLVDELVGANQEYYNSRQ